MNLKTQVPKLAILLILSTTLLTTASAQNVQVEGLEFEDVNETYTENGVRMETSYLNKTVSYRDLFIPEELDKEANINTFIADYSTVERPELDDTTVRFRLTMTYAKSVGADYPNQNVSTVLGGGETGTYKGDNFISKNNYVDIAGNNSVEGEVLDTSINEPDDQRRINISVESHYEHIIVNYDIINRTGQIVQEYQNVYSGNDTRLATFCQDSITRRYVGSVGEIRNYADFCYDNKHESSQEVTAYAVYDSSMSFGDFFTNASSFESVDANYPDFRDYALENGMSSSALVKLSERDYKVKTYNLTIPEDSVVDMNYYLSEDSDKDFYMYVKGSAGGGGGIPAEEWTFEGGSPLGADVSNSGQVFGYDGSGVVQSLSVNGVSNWNTTLSIDGSGNQGDVDHVQGGSLYVVGDGAKVFEMSESGSVLNSQSGQAYQSYEVNFVPELNQAFSSGWDGNCVRLGDGCTYSNTLELNSYSSDFSSSTYNGISLDGSGDYHYAGQSLGYCSGSLWTEGGTSIYEINPSDLSSVSSFTTTDIGDPDRVECSSNYVFAMSGSGIAKYTHSGSLEWSKSKSLYVEESGGNGQLQYHDGILYGLGGNDLVSINVSNGNTIERRTLTLDNNREIEISDNGDYIVVSGDGYTFFDRSNSAPSSPSLNGPSDGATGLDNSVTLEVGVSDPDGDSMSVTFYDGSGNQIGSTQTGVSDGGTASVTWSGLNWGTTYNWYAVADDGSATTTSNTWSFTTNEVPNPSFTSNSPVLTENDLGLDASGSSDPDGDSLGYSWDFDQDGTFEGSGVTPSHSYSDDGNYDITLKADDGHTTSTTTNTVSVENRAPTADFSFTKNDKTLDVDGTSSSDQDGSISSWEWDWTNDGNFESTGSTASKTFSSGGNYDVELRVTDDDSATDTVIQTVSINKDPVLDSFSLNNSDAYYGDTIGGTASVSDPDGDSISDVKFTATKDGSTVYSGESGTYVGGGEWSAPGVKADCADCSIEITVESVTDSNGGTSTYSSSDSVTVQNTPPQISSQRFNNSSPDFGDNVVFKADVTDQEYGVQEVRVSVWEGNSKILDNVSASGSSGTYSSPGFTVDEADTEYTATVSYVSDSSGETSSASAQGVTDPSISTSNTAPTIQDLKFNNSNPGFGEDITFQAQVFDEEYGLNESSLEFTVYKDSNTLFTDNPESLGNSVFESRSFTAKDTSAEYSAEVSFAEDTQGFSTSSDTQGLTRPEFGVEPLNISNSSSVTVKERFTDARSDVVLDSGDVGVDVSYLVENNLSIDATVDIQSAVPDNCSIDSGTTGTVPAGSEGNVSTVVSCPVGSTSAGFLNVEDNEPTSSYETVHYESTATVESSYFNQNSIYWDVNESSLRKWSDREIGSAQLLVDGNSSNTSVQYLSGQETIRGIIESPSLDKGSYSLELSYYYPVETDGTSGGGGGGGSTGGSDSGNEEESNESSEELTIQIEDPDRGINQRRGLVKHSIEFGTTGVREVKIENVVPERNQLKVEVPNSGFCQYVSVQEELGVSTVGDRGVYTLPASTSTSTRFIQVQYSTPDKETLQSKGITDYSCSLNTTASTGSADPMDLQVSQSSELLSNLDLDLQLWGKEYCLGQGDMDSMLNASMNYSESQKCSGELSEGPTPAGIGGAAALFSMMALVLAYRSA